MTPEQQATILKLTWPNHGVMAHHLETVVYVNGVRVVVYPNGKIDILNVDNPRWQGYRNDEEDHIRENHSDLILNHIKTTYSTEHSSVKAIAMCYDVDCDGASTCFFDLAMPQPLFKESNYSCVSYITRERFDREVKTDLSNEGWEEWTFTGYVSSNIESNWK